MSKIIKQTMYGYDYEIEVDERDRPLITYRIEKDGSKSFVCSYEYYGDIIKSFKREDGYETNRDIVDGKVVRDYDNKGNEICFKYDDRGNIIEKISNTINKKGTEYFKFDELNRLIESSNDSGYVKKISYYDDTENIKHTEDSLGMEYDYYINGNIKNHRDKTNGISYTMEYYDDNSPKFYADNRGTVIEYNIDGTIAKMVKSKNK